MNTGLRLRTARETRGLTIDALARATRVQRRILEAIERNDTGGIPPRPYGRGFVRAFAKEVGLEPDQTVREFFSQFAPAAGLHDEPVHAVPERTPLHLNPRWRAIAATTLMWALGVAFAVLAVRSVVNMLDRSGEPQRTDTASAAAPVVAGTTGTAEASRPASADRSPITVTLEATGPAWVTAHADGRRIIYRTLQPGDREVLRAEREVRLRIGNAGAVRWRINDRPPAPLGAPGEVRTVVITPQSIAR